MKTSLFTSLLCASVMIVAVGCGKDNSSGGGKQPVAQNPYTGNIPVNSQEAFNKFKNWYASSTEGQFPGLGQKTEYREVRKYGATNGCETKPIEVFGVSLGNLNYCFNQSQQAEVQTTTRVVNVLASQTKSSNSRLAQAYTGSGMRLANVIEGQSSFGTYYQLEYVKSNNHRVVYLVDTGINSAFNPVQITDSEAKTVEVVSNIR